MAHGTASQSPRERRREANLQKILDGAMEMVIEGGFGALSMNKLADACDYTPGALYRYFESKDALYGALVDRVLDELHALLVDAKKGVPATDPFGQLFAMVRAYRRFSLDQPNKFGLIAMSIAEPYVLLSTPESTEPVVSSIIAVLSPIAETLAAAEARGMLAHGAVHERTLLLFSAVQGVVQLRKQTRVAPGLLDLDHLSAAMVRTLLLGWGAESASVSLAHEEARSGEPS